MTYTVTSGPASEPLTTSEAKNWLKVDASTDDTLIDSLIKAARIYAERYTGRALYTQTIKEYYDCWDSVLRLSFSPVQSITSVKYLDTSGVLQTVDSSDYTTDLISRPARIAPNPDYSWPTLGAYPNAVEVTYVAGATTTGAIPDTIKTAMLLIIAFWYENREDIPISGSNDPKIRSAHTLLHLEKIFH